MMKREDIQQLLGGYAAGTLTPGEQRILFAAAMDDQELFNALAGEQALKELLDDPESRGYLRAALAESPVAEAPRKRWWPAAAGLSAIAAGLAIFTVVTIQRSTRPASPVMTASKPAAIEMAKNVPAQPESNATAPRAGADPPKDTKSALKRFEPPSTAATAATEPKRREATPVVLADAPPALGPGKDKNEKKAGEVDAGVAAPVPPPPPPPAARVIVDDLKASTRASASQLFLNQYRQNFASSGGGGSAQKTFATGADGRKRAESPAAPRQQGQQPQEARRDAPQTQERESQLAPVAPANRGIRYQILRKNSQGQYVQTRLDTRFESGDEIMLQVDKNSPGVVSILAGTGTVAIPSQSAAQASSAPMRLSAGTLDVSIIFTEAAPETRLFAPTPGQLMEQTGNLMYVVLPGSAPAPVVAQLRITVH